MPEDISHSLKEALAYINALDVKKEIDKGAEGAFKSGKFIEIFEAIHDALYEGTCNQAAENRLTDLRRAGVFDQVKDALVDSGGKKTLSTEEMADVLARFHQRAIDEQTLPYGDETALTIQTFNYFIAKNFGHDIDYRRMDEGDIEALKDTEGSLRNMKRAFTHALDKERPVDASLRPQGEMPEVWKPSDGKHDPRLPEDPRLLHVFVDVDKPETFSKLLDRNGEPMTPESLKRTLSKLSGVREDSPELNDIRMIITNEGGLVRLKDFRAYLENKLSEYPLNAPKAPQSDDDALPKKELPERYKGEDGRLDIRKVEGEHFEIPTNKIIGRLDGLGVNNPLKKYLLDKDGQNQSQEPQPHDYYDAPYIFSDKTGFEKIYNNRKDMITGANLDINEKNEHTEQRKAFALGYQEVIRMVDDDGKDFVVDGPVHKGWVRESAERLEANMAKNDEPVKIDRDELRDLFFTYQLMKHPRVAEHNTDYRKIHNFNSEMYDAVTDIVIEKGGKGAYITSMGGQGVGKSTILRSVEDEMREKGEEIGFVRSGSNPDMDVMKKMHAAGHPTRLEVILGDPEECLGRALERKKREGRMTAPELSAPMFIKAMRRVPEMLESPDVDKVRISDNSDYAGPPGTFKVVAETEVMGQFELQHYKGKTEGSQGYKEGDDIKLLKIAEMDDGKVKVLKIFGEEAEKRLAGFLEQARRPIIDGATPYEDFNVPQLPMDAGITESRSLKVDAPDRGQGRGA